MADFKFEVMATYAEQENLKVRSVSFNDRDPKFDIRHWNTKDGKEVMGKGVTLTIEELQFLALQLPIVIAELTGDNAKATTKTKAKATEKKAEPVAEETSLFDDDATETEEESSDEGMSERAQKLVAYLIKGAPDKLKGVNVADNITYATNGKVVCALKGVSSEKESTAAIKKAYDAAMPSDLKEIKASLVKKMKDNTVKLMKKGTMFSFGKEYTLVNAEYIGKAIRAVGENAKLYTNAENKLYIAKGDDGAVIVIATTVSGREFGLQKVA